MATLAKIFLLMKQRGKLAGDGARVCLQVELEPIFENQTLFSFLQVFCFLRCKPRSVLFGHLLAKP